MSLTPDISVELFARLKSIDRKRKLAEWRYSLWIAAPFLVIIPFVFAFAIDSRPLSFSPAVI